MEAHEFTTAHILAPSNAEASLAWLELQPPANRALLLNSLLASHPNLAPDLIARLTTELALLSQKKICTPIELPNTAKLTLVPIPFRGKFTRGWAFKMAVNGNNLPLVELDTSISGIILNPKDAQKAGVHPIGPPPASPDAIYTAYADLIHIGPVAYRDCPVRVAPERALAGANSVIGTDFFRNNLMHIDFFDATVTLTPLPDPHAIPDTNNNQDWIHVYINGPQLLVPTLVNKKGPFLFQLDSGSGSTILSTPLAAKLLLNSSDPTINRIGYLGDFLKIVPQEGGVNQDRAEIRGPDGNLVKVGTPFKAPSLRFAKTEMTDLNMITLDLKSINHLSGIEVSGLLGFHLMRYFSFDLNYRDGLARITFDQNRRYVQREANQELDPIAF